MTQRKLEPTLRAAADSDVDWLLELRLTTMADYIERSGETLSMDDQRARVLADFDSVRIVLLASDPVGMIKIVREPDVWRLVQIQFRPEHQGRGLGALLIRQLLQEATRARVPVTLSVLKVNPAKRLYDRLGFRVTGESPGSYQMRFDV